VSTYFFYSNPVHRTNTLDVGASYIVVLLTVYNTHADCQEFQSLWSNQMLPMPWSALQRHTLPTVVTSNYMAIFRRHGLERVLAG